MNQKGVITDSIKEPGLSIHFVDLGLSVKWGSCNIGASNPIDFGDYFAWGETETKKVFSWETYNNLASYTRDEQIAELDINKDVANIKLGGNWRIPSVNDFNELLHHCTWIWTKIKGVAGYKVTSKEKGFTDNYIFLPAAGYIDNETSSGIGSFGAYWSRTIAKDYSLGANYLYLNSDASGITDYYRRCGHSIRPVYIENNNNENNYE